MKRLEWHHKLLVTGVIGIVFLFMMPYLMLTEFKEVKLLGNQGRYDLSEIDMDSKVFELGGTVETYANMLIEPESFVLDLDEIGKHVEYTGFPISWNINEGITTATHRLVINGLIPGNCYGIQMMEALTAYKVYADGHLVMGNGNVSMEPENSVGEADPKIGWFTAAGDTVELVFQVSNHEAHMTGIWQKIYFGRAKEIIGYQEALVRRDIFIFGCIFIMGLYHLLLYMVMRKDKAILYFSIFCFSVAVKSAFSGQQFGYIWIPFVSYGAGLRIAYLMITSIAVSVLAFLKTCFPNEVQTIWIRIGWSISALQAIVILIAPQAFYQGTFIGYQIFIFLMSGAILFWSSKAVINKNEAAGLYLLGFLGFVITVTNDVLYSMMILKTGYMLGLGLFILILAQAITLAYRMLNAFESVEKVRSDLEGIVVERTHQIEIERNRFEYLSKVDGLTQIYNKRFLSELFEIEFESYVRYGTVFSLIIADIDFFKHVNDTYGHLAGDEVLKIFSQIIKSNSRRTDIIGRFGGEEFLVVMRYAKMEEAMLHAENLRIIIENTVFETKTGPIRLTASFGVTEVVRDMHSSDAVLQRVDEALYLAKTHGRNRVEVL